MRLQARATRLPIAVLCVALTLAAGRAANAADGDSDMVEDDVDNCFGAANPLQFDADADGIGDLCEADNAFSDDFVGSSGSDLAFGSFMASSLSGGSGNDSLYGGAGEDLIDGGRGLDALIGGPGDDVLIGGPECDTFAVEAGIEHRDVIRDFDPLVDRIRFPARVRRPAVDRLPNVSAAGTTDLEVRFRYDHGPVATVVFVRLAPGVPVVLSTLPCGNGPPPADICPQRGAFRVLVFVGFEDRWCPGRGELRINTGILATERFNAASGKLIGA